MVRELRRVEQAGQPVHFDYLTGPQVRQAQPGLSPAVGAAVLIHGQRYIHPPRFVRSLAHAVVDGGGKLREWVRVVGIDTEPHATWLTDDRGGRHRHDAVVLATGATLGTLARSRGVRRLVQAGRGYSFTVGGDQVPSGPVYFPDQRVACTPLHEPADPDVEPGGSDDGDEPRLLRVAGMMEFRRPDEPLDPRRIRAIVDAVRPLLDGVDLDDRRDEWVGSRPCTSDGLPLVGATNDERVFVAGGHGMWGVVLGPVTGRLLAERIVTGRTPAELRPFDPVR
jgi:D-amino-acid dehydrogenase